MYPLEPEMQLAFSGNQLNNRQLVNSPAKRVGVLSNHQMSDVMFTSLALVMNRILDCARHLRRDSAGRGKGSERAGSPGQD